jgi:cytochrome b6-f complex iron-sulfur subunit
MNMPADTRSEQSVAESPTAKPGVSRRDFFNEIAGCALAVAGIGAAVVTVQYSSPNVLFEPPTTFRIGTPDDYPVNSVTYIQDRQVYIVRSAEGFSAISAVCTHLGCITQWKAELNQIACPCHGSKFERNGSVIAGPAPRPLPHLAIRLAADGTLVVDKLEIVKLTEILKV